MKQTRLAPMIWLMLVAAAAASPVSAKPGELKTFRDWTVGCDNGRACHATSLMPEGDFEQTPGLSVERGPEAAAQPAVTLLAEGGKEYRLRTGKGQVVRVVARSSSPDYRIDPRDLGTLLTALRGDARITVEDGAGAKQGDVSLAGISAALLYIDEQQKRIGTATALARPGARPASSVPPPPPLPVVRSLARKGPTPFTVPQARIAALRKQYGCVQEDKDFPGYDLSQGVLDPNRVLLLMGCGAGAYNFSSLALIATRRGKAITVAPARYDFSPSGGPGQPLLTNAEWDDASGILGMYAKGRGLGDCGTMAQYAWDGQRFRLVEQSEMRECRGSIDYITTWRARVVR